MAGGGGVGVKWRGGGEGFEKSGNGEKIQLWAHRKSLRYAKGAASEGRSEDSKTKSMKQLAWPTLQTEN